MKRVRIQLSRKLAENIDGVDLSGRAVGDVFHVDTNEARLLVAEGWAVEVGSKPKERPSIIPLRTAKSY